MFKRIFDFLKFKKKKPIYEIEEIEETIIPSEEDGVYEESFIGGKDIDIEEIATDNFISDGVNPFNQYRVVDRRIETWSDCLVCNRRLFTDDWKEKLIQDGDNQLLKCEKCQEVYKIINIR